MGLNVVRRCIDCIPSPHFCEVCLVKMHSFLPTHRVQVSSLYASDELTDQILKIWRQGLGWIKQDLHEYDIEFHLGHGGCHCPSPKGTIMLVLLHTNGFHRIPLWFCGCSTNAEDHFEWKQLVAAQLFPASME